MKKTVFLMVLLCGMLCAGAAELLPNPAFQENFKNWTRRGAVSGLKTDGVSAVFSGGKSIFLIQYNLPIKPGKYVVSYRISGNGKYRTYCENFGKTANGGKFYRTSGSHTLTAPAKEEMRSFTFTIKAEDLPSIKTFALVFLYQQGQEIRLTAPSLQLDNGSAAAPEVRQKGEWRFSGGSHFTDGVLKQINNSGSNLPRTRWYPDSVKPGRSYRFSCRTHGKRTTDKSGFCKFQILPIIDGKEVGGSSWDDTLISEIQRKRIEFTVPAQAQKVGMDFVSGAKSEVWFSDMKLAEIPPVQKVSTIELLSPGYRDSVYSSMPVKEIAGILRFEDGAVSADVTLFCGGKKIASRHSTGNFAFPSPGKDCTVRAELLDKNGKKLTVIEKNVRFLSPARNEVVIGQDRKIYINGKLFFPVGMTELPAVHEPDGYYYAARNGINCTTLSARYVKTPAEVLPVLDRAQKAGLYVSLYVYPRINELTSANREEYKKKLREFFIPQIITHPAFLGYYLTDEPLWVGLPLWQVQTGYELLRELDPYHPIFINEAPRNSVEAQRNYAKYSDIYSIDIYPFPYPNAHSHLKDKSLTCIGKYADFLHNVVEHRKPVWLVLQGFSWYAYYKLDNGTDYPSLTHTRFMCFDSLFHDAAPSLWGTRHIRAAAYYDNLFQVTRELHQLSGLFARGKKTGALRTSHPDVIAEIYEAEGHQYLAIRNASEKPLIAELYGKYPAMKRLLPQGVKQELAPRRDQIALEAFETVFFGTAPLPEPAYSLPARDAALEKGDNPYKRIIKADFGRRKYLGHANWIWDGRDAGAYSKAVVQKEFAVDLENTANVTLRVSVDDRGEVIFNGKTFLKCEGFINMLQKDVPAALLKKNNILTVRGEDSGCVPCGVLAEIIITGKDGKTQTLVSDGSWKCSDGRPVQIIAPFGKGAWGNRALVQEVFE